MLSEFKLAQVGGVGGVSKGVLYSHSGMQPATGSCEVTLATDIPDFVKAWGTVRRAIESELRGIEKDERISLSDIYALTVSSKTFAQSKDVIFVVPAGCAECKRQKQACSRGSPCKLCRRPELAQRCVPVGPDWTKLPGPKFRKGKFNPSKKICFPGYIGTARGIARTSLAGRKLLRPAAQSARSHLVRQCAQKSMNFVKTSSHADTYPKSGGHRLKFTKNRKEDPTSEISKRRGDRCDESDNTNPLTRKEQLPNPIVCSEPIWVVVSPPRTPKSVSQAGNSDKICPPPSPVKSQCGERPQIWTSSLSDLVEALPELEKAVNGVSCIGTDNPVLILSQQAWPDDKWDGNTIEFTMVRKFSYITGATNARAVTAAQSQNDPTVAELTTNTQRSQIDTNRSDPVSLTRSGLQPHPIPACPDELSFLDPGIHANNVQIDLQTSPTGLLHGDEMTSDDQAIPNSTGIPMSMDQLISHITPTTTDEIPMNPSDWPDHALSLPHSLAEQLNRHNPKAFANDWRLNNDRICQNDAIDLRETFFRLNVPTVSTESVRSIPNENTQDSVEPGVTNTTRSVSQPFAIETPTLPIPAKVPGDISTLRLSHEIGTPVRVVVSRDYSLLPFSLPPECAYAFLGFFHITHMDVLQSNDAVKQSSTAKRRNPTSSRVTWRFKLNWAAAGAPNSVSVIEHAQVPWWTTFSIDSDSDRYACFSSSYPQQENVIENGLLLLPSHVSNPTEEKDVPGRFRSGWHCDKCGKLNVRLLITHWLCSHCSRELEPEPAIHPSRTRNPQRLQIAKCTYPTHVKRFKQAWGDGMFTFEYSSGGRTIVKHITTNNVAVLLKEADMLFTDFQSNVNMSRVPLKSPSQGMYFAHTGLREAPSSGSMEGFHCVSRACDVMLNRTRVYGEDHNLSSVHRLKSLAWMDLGGCKLRTKNPKDGLACHSDLLDARYGTVLVMCLGADLQVSLLPKGDFGQRKFALQEQSLQENPCQENLSTNTVLQSSGPPSDELASQAALSLEHETEPVVEAETDTAASMKVLGKRKLSDLTPSKAGKTTQDITPITITLMHGDILAVSGDHFECNFKRMGFTILLIGASS